MILVGQFDSPFVRRVAVTLHHYRMPYTRNPISVFRDVEKMRKINPLVRVPSLILETGEVLIDSSAIIDHLDEMAGPARALTPAHGPERRKVLQAVAVAVALGVGEKAVALFYERLFHIDKHINRDFEKRMMGQISAALGKLEHDCGAPWFFDERMTQADITTGCLAGFMKMRVPDMFQAGKYPKLHHLALHCETKEDFVKARPSPDETAPGQTRH
ncbi:glutathione S-transferase family protein [Aestuariivirga sp.]|uniref:glutathione S-transferase family protein n=1 Tax=Aestuariivirga sp. TaxID=2650926 RepID=UPI0025BB6EFC|nr:glutathione S-transferase family protein [Aestuariivirga sp.]